MDENEDLVLPHKSEDLVELLNKLYPEKSPELKDDTKTVYFKEGKMNLLIFFNTLQ
jgi:hypothetical protein